MKAVMMLSGGLDSSLALKMIVEQGVEVEALHFGSNFCRCDGAREGCGSAARVASDFSGVKLRVVHLGEEYLKIIKNPKHGYGKNINPCIDCRIIKFQYAKKIMEEIGASFIVTGEVLGQRPMSQHRQAINLIEKNSGLKDLIVRPLSAKLLEPSLPEREGWVNRDLFLDITGRSRKVQIEMAKEYGINDYPCPAGGCLLTDTGFSNRMKDLINNGKLDLNNVELIKVGRLFRISENAKLVVGRKESENNRLLQLAHENDFILEPVSVPGPTAIARGQFNDEDLMFCAGIVARYSDSDNATEVEIRSKDFSRTVLVSGIKDEILKGLII